MAKIIQTSGRRKRSSAKATLREGKGRIRINSILLDVYEPMLARLKLREPLMLAEDTAQKVDIDLSVRGGGFMSQADACRLAISRGLAKFDRKLEKVFLQYDRQLLVADVRRKETCKPNDSKARAKRQKSYR
jgi:small subunit ribosomal protein S9